MKIKLTVICTAIVASLFIISCASPLVDKPGTESSSANTGVLSLTLSGVAVASNASARTIVPGTGDLPAITGYAVTLSRLDYADKTASFTAPSLTVDIPGLEAGEWVITVNGKIANGDIMATGTSTVTIALPGPTPVTVALAYIGASTGNTGAFTITLLIPKTAGITSGTSGVEATLDGMAISPAPTVADNGDGINDKVVCSATGIASASPLLRIALKKSSATMLYWAERVWVYKNIITTKKATIALTDFGAPPSAPVSLTPALQNDNTVLLKWDNVDIADGYTLERSQDSGSTYSVVASSIAAGTLQYNDSSTVYATSYIYRVQSRNVFGPSSGFALSSSITTRDIPAAPSIVQAYATQLTLNWTPTADCKYEIWYSTVSNTSTPAPIRRFPLYGEISGPKFTISGLANNTTYYIWLKEKNTTTGITSGFGHVASGTTITPPPAIWDTASLIETDDDGNAENPQVAFNTSGNGIAAWHQSNGTKMTIRASRYSAGAGWGTPVLIQTKAYRDGYKPQVAIDASGNIVIVWTQTSEDDNSSEVWSSSYHISSSSWTSPVMIETLPYPSSEPSISMDGNDNIVAVWRLGSGTNYCHLRSNRYQADTQAWGTAVDVASGLVTDIGELQFAINASGNGMAVWVQKVGNTWLDIYGCTYTSGVWGTPALLDRNNIYVAVPQVKIDSSGNALVLWEQRSTVYTLFSARYTASGSSWGEPVLLGTNAALNTSTGFLAMNATGNAMAIWKQNDGPCTNEWARSFSATTGWGTAVMIETNDAGDVENDNMAVAIDPAGNATAVWPQSDGNASSCWSNYYNTSTGLWSTAEIIDGSIPSGVYTPAVSFVSSGKAVALWCQYDGTRTNIRANKMK